MAASTSLDLAIAREPDETEAEYECFLKFVSLHGKNRHINVVAEALGYSHVTLISYHKKNRWSDRASIVDAMAWKRQYEQRLDDQKESNIAFAEKNRLLRERALKISDSALSVCEGLLAKAELADEVIETDKVETKDGRIVPIYTTIKMKAKISDIPPLLTSAIRVARLVQDLPTEIIESKVPATTDIASMSDAELNELRDEVAKVLRDHPNIQAATSDFIS